MPAWVAFLRAVNVGGTGKLSMADLRAMCADIGFSDVQTYIASGNVAFCSDSTKQQIKTALQDKLAEYAGKPVPVIVRTAAELQTILRDNPFADGDPKRTLAILLDARPPKDALAAAVGRVDEEMQLGKREIYVHYPSGIGNSKLRIPAAKEGTARNMNTIARMAELSSR